MRKLLLTVLSVLLLAGTAMAQGVPFRKHRYDGFKTHKIDKESIVFWGNSITNMHEWWEAFSSNKHIVNRGVNGAETPIMLENFETILAGKPAKVFLMMGTNDLGTAGLNTPEAVEKNVRTAVQRLKKESPETKVFVQCILPCNGSGIKKDTDVPVTNALLKKMCEEEKVTFIDIYDKMTGIKNGSISYDGTHVTMTGYRTWCNAIAEHVGHTCVYPTDATDANGGLSGIAGMRTTYFSALPIKANDIVVLGDDGNDWHELLHADNVKQRGGSWGYQGIDLGTMLKMVPQVFKGRTDNVEPKMVICALGYKEVQGTTDLTSVQTSYKEVVDKVRALCPKATIKLMAVYPSPTANINTTRTTAFNALLKTMAEGMTNVDYVAGSYDDLVAGNVIKSDYYSNGYMTGKGYAKLSQVYATAIGSDNGVTATTDDEAAQLMAQFTARTSLYNAIATAEGVSIGTGVGQYTAENASTLTSGITAGYTLLAKADATNDELTKKATEYTSLVTNILPTINQPTASTTGSEHWYQLYTPNRGSYYMTANGAGKSLTGGTNTKYARTMWKFVKRTDGSYDIINRKDGTYVSPSANYDSAISTTADKPTQGWTLSNANVAGVFIIASGTVELNQTTKDGKPIYNWSAGKDGKDKADYGCQFAIVDAPEVVEEPEAFKKGDITISTTTGKLTRGSTVVDASTYGNNWTSTRTNPQVVLSCGTNNMSVSGTDITVAPGANGCTFTINAGEGYVITGYKWTMVNKSGTAVTTITAGGKEYQSSNKEQQVEVTDVNTQTVTFTEKGQNQQVVLKNFVVSVKKVSFERGNFTVNVGNGTLTNTSGNTSGSYFVKWTSTNTEPQLTLKSGSVNNMSKSDGNIVIATGGTQNCTYTLDAGEGYRITGYQFTYVNGNTATGDTKLTIGGKEMTTAATEQTYTSGRLDAQTASFNLTGTNKPIVLKNFIVTIKDADLDTSNEPEGMRIDLTNGTFNNGSNKFNSQWTSDYTDPQVVLGCGNNNMAAEGNNLTLYVGSVSSECTYTLTASNGYRITGYQFDFVNCASNTEALTLTVDGKEYKTSGTKQHVSVSDITRRIVPFSLAGSNKGIVVSNFFVTYEATAPVEKEEQTNLFITKGLPNYRIPAVATAKNGNIVVMADYRYNGSDAGGGKIDMAARVSKDNGKTWGNQFFVAKAADYVKGTEPSTKFMHTCFGDPCLVADRESNRMLMICCSGDVMFPNATRDNHQAMARFYSEDGGETWSKPTDISESIYSLFDKSTIGTPKSMFIGSGRIFQSSTVKVGTHYRIYCSVIYKDVNGTNKNYVIYSDNFGDTWNVLGGANVAPVPSGADEPKTEELPDGSVICSSRINGGRYYNIFHFTDAAKAEGSWGTVATSNYKNNGVEALSNSCNGEVMVLPVTRNSDKQPMHLILQSVPMGSGRANVGIFYKELATGNDYATPEALAKNWTGSHQASFIGSAYSTMTLQSDNTLGFVYEEATFNNKAYTIVYKNYTIEHITNGAYSYRKVDGGSTGITSAAQAATVNARIYDLQGRRVSKATKGVYVVNGAKVVK